MDIHLDFVFSHVECCPSLWPDLDIDWDDLRKIELYGVNVTVPNKRDTDQILSAEYGANWLTHHTKYHIYN